jgi:hypothetical protein
MSVLSQGHGADLILSAFSNREIADCVRSPATVGYFTFHRGIGVSRCRSYPRDMVRT